jgi:hypothetical protein
MRCAHCGKERDAGAPPFLLCGTCFGAAFCHRDCLRRGHAYLDDRVVHAITSGFRVVASRGTSNFATALGVDEQSWNAANKVSRSMRRRHQLEAPLRQVQLPFGLDPDVCCN